MKKELSGVAARVLPLLEGTVSEAGCFLWNVEFVKEGARRVLRLTIDKDDEEGVGIEDCERVHRAVDPILDEADPIEGAYYLEVTSPGLERDIALLWHVEACTGERVSVKLFAAHSGAKHFVGTLLGFTDSEKNELALRVGEEEIRLPYESVSKMNVAFDFDSL